MPRPLGRLRIIGGRWRGRGLSAPPGRGTRPLTDRIRQSFCDWLGQDFTGRAIIDICAGSGCLGLELASRGADRVDLVENDAGACAVAADNIAALGAAPVCRLHRGDFRRVLPRLAPADLVFCDPPFPWYASDPAAVAELVRLAVRRAPRVAIRGERGRPLILPDGARESERRDYGRSWIALLEPDPSAV